METTETSQTGDSCCNVNFEEIRQRTEDYVRDEPVKAVGIAILAGIILTVFPVFRLTFGFLRLALALLKPALLILGGMKLYEELTKRYSA